MTGGRNAKKAGLPLPTPRTRLPTAAYTLWRRLQTEIELKIVPVNPLSFHCGF